MSAQGDNRSRLRIAVIIILILVGALVWYLWPSATVDGAERQLNRDAPVGTPRSDVEAWLEGKRVEHSYSQDFRYNTIFEQQGIGPGVYSGYICAILRDTDRGLFITGSIQFYVLFDENDRVARHIVRWFGTGL
jgi:hypothetical protein